MVDLAKDIHSMTDFKRKTNALTRQMKKTGHPLVLTVNGRAKYVVQDVESYQALLASADHADTVRSIKHGIDEVDRGEFSPAATALGRIRQKHRIPRA